MKSFVLFLLLTANILSVIQAKDIIWFNQLFQRNVESDGVTSFTNDWVFELGTFIPRLAGETEDFDPRTASLDTWAAHWVPLGKINYNDSFLNYYTENTPLINNDPPFEVGARAYVWGYNTNSPNAEWILLTDEQWLYPVGATVEGADLDPEEFALTYDSNSEAIIGQIDPLGTQLANGPILMQSEAVSGVTGPGDRTFEGWIQRNFSFLELSDPLTSGPLADPDGNGLSNLIEYALFFDSRNGALTQSESTLPNTGVALQRDVSDPSIVNASFIKPFNTTDLEYTFQVSSDAVTWTDIDAASFSRISISSPSAGAETVTLRDIKQIPGLETVGLVRVQVTLVNGSATPVIAFTP